MLTSALIFGLGGLQVFAAEATQGDVRGPKIVPAPYQILTTENMSVDASQVIWIKARNTVQWVGAETPTFHPKRRNFTPAEETTRSEPWIYTQGEGPRQGLYDPPEPNEFTSYAYENNSWFRLVSTGATAPPRTSQMLDVIQLAGDCPAPPIAFNHIDFCFRAMSTNPAYDYGILYKFWDDFDVNGGFGGSVVANQIGSVLFNFGPIPTLVGYILCFGGVDTGGNPVATFPVPVFPDDPDVGVEVNYVNGSTGALGSGTPFFAVGPPRAEPTLPSNAPIGTSDQFFYVDTDLNGTLGTDNRVSFANTVVNKGNFFLHLMGFQNPNESEPNNSLATPDHACLCSNRSATITPIIDPVDWVKFTLQVAGDIGATIDTADCSTNDSTLVLRDGGGTAITSNDDISATNLCSSVTASLAAGDYYLEIHEKGDNASLAYDLILKPLAGKVSNLKYSTTIVPAPKSVLTWDAQGSGATYDVVRGNIESLHLGGFCGIDGGTWAPGDFTSACALPDCWSTNLASPSVVDITNPVGPSDSLFYLVRAKNSCQGIGSYDEGGNQDHPRDAQILANASANPCP